MGKSYWLKIGKNEDIKILKNEKYQGISYDHVRFRPSNSLLGSDVIDSMSVGDQIIIYSKEEMKFYIGEIKSLEEGKTSNKDKWVHLMYINPLMDRDYYLGQIEDWSNLSNKLDFWKSYPNIGLALNCSIWELDKNNFENIKEFFIRK